MSKTKAKITLRWQFIRMMLLILVSVALMSGSIQYYLLLQQVKENVNNEAMLIARSIEQGIKETDFASRSIEQQIDYKLEAISQRIGDRLQGKTINDISNQNLIQLRDEFHIAGITLFARKEDDIVGVRATDEKEIGFSFKKTFGPEDSGFLGLNDLLNEKKPVQEDVSFVDQNIIILYTSQSGSHNDEPVFFKYAYYHVPGEDFVINAYIEANEVYQFTQKVGPDAWIDRVVKENQYVKEVAVLDPRVFADPTLEKRMYPPMKKIVHGTYTYQDKRDQDVLINMLKETQKVSYEQKQEGGKVYKMFLPFDEGRVIYIALDYDKMSAPIFRHSLILIIFSLLSLLAMFMLTARFFSKIYANIHEIIMQIKQLEAGDLTAKSSVTGGGELGDLSDSINKMAASLHQLLIDTHEKATKAQRVSILLEAEANQSVEKVFTMSMETTAKARESIEEINFFLDQVEVQLEPQKENPRAKEILDNMDQIRRVVREGTNNATEITITLSDLLKSLHGQSSELSDISNSLLKQLSKFKL